jgi:hypothetical protein
VCGGGGIGERELEREERRNEKGGDREIEREERRNEKGGDRELDR